MSDFSNRLWSKGFLPIPGEPWTLEDHDRIRALHERIAELEAQCESLQNKCATRGLSPEDSDALEAENERLIKSLEHEAEMARVWKANAEALANVANRAEAHVEQIKGVLLKCSMNHTEAHYIAQAELDRLEALAKLQEK